MRPTPADAARDEFVTEIVDELPRLFGLAWAMTRDRALAEDLAQEAALRAVDHRRSISGTPGPYVRSILMNLIRDSRRRAALRAKSLTLEVALDGPMADHADSVAVRLELEEQLRRLGPRQHEVVVLRYYADLSFAEIASLLNRPPGTVRRWCSEALATLSKLSADARHPEPKD